MKSESRTMLQRLRKRNFGIAAGGQFQRRAVMKYCLFLFFIFTCVLVLMKVQHFRTLKFDESSPSEKSAMNVELRKMTRHSDHGMFPKNVRNPDHEMLWRKERGKIDDSYSSLPLDRLKNYHLEVATEQILTRVPSKIDFLIKERDICLKFISGESNSQLRHKLHKAGGTEVDVAQEQGAVAVAVVSSALRNFRERQNVRNSWGRPLVARRTGIPVVFLVGATTSARGQQSLVRESLAFRDIVQADFLDTYNNLSVKSLAGLSWAAQYCPTAHWVLKTDDDMSVNVFALSHLLQTFQENIHSTKSASSQSVADTQRHSQIGWPCKDGKCILCDKMSTHATVLDSQAYKFGVSANEWKEKTYPPYCHGVGYLVATHAVPALLAAAHVTNYVRVEDVFVTGILAGVAGLPIELMHPPTPWHLAYHARDRVNAFLEGERLTLELDRDLEGGSWTGPEVWEALQRRHNTTLT